MQRAPTTPFNAWPERVWPLDRKSAAPGIVLGGAIVAGFIGAATVRVTAIGIGFLLLGVAVLAVSLGTRRRWPAPVQGAAAVAVCALLAVGAVRSAGWLFTLCVLAAGVVGTIALVGGRSWTGLLMGVFAPALAQVRTVGWTFRGMRHASESDRSAQTGRMIAVGAVTLALLIVFGGLFASADAVFADLVSGLIPELSVPNLVYRVFMFVVFTGLTLTAACLAHRPPNFDGLAPGPGRPFPRWEWAVPLAVLDLLFATFVAVQLAVLFGDRQHVLTTVGLTYADYARQGFWQLLVVTALTLAVVAVAARKVNRERRADRVVARILLGVLCGLALVIVASAMRRMWLYEDEFGFTRLRILVHATELWLGVVFVLILVAGVALRGRWLPRAVVGAGVLVLLGLAALNPDAYIAEQNVARFERTGKIDVIYLSGLTADAVPALNKLDEPNRSCALLELKDSLEKDEPWFQYNWARERAREVLAARPAEHSPTCPGAPVLVE
jgi:hypothetical protein